MKHFAQLTNVENQVIRLAEMRHLLAVIVNGADSSSKEEVDSAIAYIQGSVDDIFYRSAHPYTVGLKTAMPDNKTGKQQLQEIPGTPPDLFAPPAGCGFAARCPHAMQVCQQQPAPLFGDKHRSRCWLQHEAAPAHPLRDALLAVDRS